MEVGTIAIIRAIERLGLNKMEVAVFVNRRSNFSCGGFVTVSGVRVPTSTT